MIQPGNGMPEPNDDGNQQEQKSQVDNVNAADAAADEVGGFDAEGNPLPKIHPNIHGTGKYKMFSNHSSANDMPGTKTGI